MTTTKYYININIKYYPKISSKPRRKNSMNNNLKTLFRKLIIVSKNQIKPGYPLESAF